MRKSRLFVRYFCFLSLAFLGVNFFIWKTWVEDLRTDKYAGGDLARMGYVYGSKMPRQGVNNLPKRHIPFSAYRGESIDILTIGDSFSNPGTAIGENLYYQDFLATQKNLAILNIQPVEGKVLAPEKTLVKLLNAGVIDQIAPRYILIQSVERSCVQRFSKMDFSLVATPEDLARLSLDNLENANPEGHKPFDFVSTANFKFLANAVSHPLLGSDLEKLVFLQEMKVPLFSVRDGDVLLYFKDDVKNLRLATDDAIIRLNANLNHLADQLAAKGIKLIFMPTPDKFNLYRPYLQNDSLPRSVFFEKLRPLPKNYLFIDTKAILAGELENGAKDLYFADDTHWSSHAIEAVFRGFSLE